MMDSLYQRYDYGYTIRCRAPGWVKKRHVRQAERVNQVNSAAFGVEGLIEEMKQWSW